MLKLYYILSSLAYGLALLPLLLTSPFVKRRNTPLERLGLIVPKQKVDIWIHASSMGEVQLLHSFLDKLFAKRSKLKVHLTVMTQNGYRAAEKHLQKMDFLKTSNFNFSFFPMDTVFTINRMFQALQPKLVLVVEGEHWPSLLFCAKKKKVPILLINGRMSQNSFIRYASMPRFSKKIFENYDFLFLKSIQDQIRYLELHVNPQKTSTVGDMKFDAPLFIPKKESILELKKKLNHHFSQVLKFSKSSQYAKNKKALIFVAGSTRPPYEEIYLLEVFEKLKIHFPNLIFIIAPRHLKRLPQIQKYCKTQNIPYRLLNKVYKNKNQKKIGQKERALDLKNLKKWGNRGGKIEGQQHACILVDAMGQLQTLYSLADLAFVGGTMSHTGGHNILEPVWAGTPVLFGPDVRNISDLSEYIIQNNYGAQVRNALELYDLSFAFFNQNLKFKKKKKQNTRHNATTIMSEFILKNYL